MRRPLHVVERGAGGPTLVFVAGVGGTTRYWESRVARLTRHYRVLLVDLLGFGHSPKPWIVYTVDRHVAELRRVLGDRERFTLIGHSFGAILAVAYAARYPEQVTGLVLFSLPCFGDLKRALAYYRGRRGLDRWLMTNIILSSVTCFVTRRLLRRFLPRLLPEFPREVVEDLVQHTWLSSTSTIWQGVYRHDVARDADRLAKELPVLCLHGDRDVTAPVEYTQRLTEDRPHWTLRVLPDVDHHPLLRDPSGCLAAIQDFVAAPKPAEMTAR